MTIICKLQIISLFYSFEMNQLHTKEPMARKLIFGTFSQSAAELLQATCNNLQRAPGLICWDSECDAHKSVINLSFRNRVVKWIVRIAIAKKHNFANNTIQFF